MSAQELLNASQPARIYYARHMQPGLCQYDKETVLVDTPALKKMIATGAPIPVYIDHQPNDLATMKERSVGFTCESFYNELDGWAWFKLIGTDDEIHLAVAKGWKVSNAYIGSQWAGAGKKNNCPFQRELIDGKFTHLAIVPVPRYEEADIMTPEEFKAYQENLKQQLNELKNSNPSPKGKPMFNLFKNEKKTVSTVDADTLIEVDGQEISIGEMLNAIKKNSDDEAAEKAKKELENSDQIVDVEGEKMPLKELVNKYNAMKKNKKNEGEETEAEKKAKEEKKNAEEKAAKEEEERKNAEDKAKKEEEEKTNSGHDYFEEMRNAHNIAVDKVEKIEAPQNGLARGRARYGSGA